MKIRWAYLSFESACQSESFEKVIFYYEVWSSSAKCAQLGISELWTRVQKATGNFSLLLVLKNSSIFKGHNWIVETWLTWSSYTFEVQWVTQRVDCWNENLKTENRKTVLSDRTSIIREKILKGKKINSKLTPLTCVISCCRCVGKIFFTKFTTLLISLFNIRFSSEQVCEYR